MEVNVLQASGLPPDALVAFKVGCERKHQKMEVGRPRQMLMTPSGPTTCAVSVLKSMGTGEILAAKTEGEIYKIPVIKADGTKTELSLKASPLPAKTSSEANAPKLQDEARNHVQALLAELLKEQPADPYAFMLQRLRAVKEGGSFVAENDTMMLRAADGSGATVTSFVRDELMSHMK
mmetsp:Transcript_23333/g.43889  ORF Transcript_23333/g.43889 Transcript_23333/m.43889 type:complete len:178 (-) Transcript_23333:70-603(-)